MNHVMMVAPNTYAAQSYYAEKVVMKMNQNAKTAQPYKPSEGRLPENIKQLVKNASGSVFNMNYPDNLEGFAIKVVAKTASIKDAELDVKEAEKKQKQMCIDDLKRQLVELDAEHQQKIAEIFEEIERNHRLQPGSWTRQLHIEGTVIIHNLSWEALKSRILGGK